VKCHSMRLLVLRTVGISIEKHSATSRQQKWRPEQNVALRQCKIAIYEAEEYRCQTVARIETHPRLAESGSMFTNERRTPLIVM